ncbi:hypothetical protein [Vogesella urethralis]|jgi:hypothetical protein|uniref:hypothetical protein n=1 Tax=Vogesella urethralis TaxID=2592656 RepID=UPI001185B9C3|nr:hypothetical protein [Vogesella urethralis]
MKTRLFVAGLLLMAGLATAQELAAPAPEARQLTFFDSRLFDGQLYNELSRKPERLEIVVPGTMTLTQFSPRLDRWMSIIGESGTLALQETPEPPRLSQRSLFALLPMVYNMVSEAREALMNAQARQYDATVYYHKDNQGNAVIDRILLKRKS